MNKFNFKLVFLLSIFGMILAMSTYSTETLTKLVKHFELKDINIIESERIDLINEWLNKTTNLKRIYLFDVLNANDILRGEKPSLKERGPYTYREIVEKRNIKYLNNQSQISYNLVKSYYFDSNLSSGSENDTITFLNLPAMVMIDSLASNDYNNLMINISKKIINKYNVQIFMNKTVKELISGYTDSLTQLASLFNPKLKNKFDLLNDKNGTASEHYTVLNSSDNSTNQNENQRGQILKWNNLNKLDFWATEEANQINGTDGFIFPTNINSNQSLYMFSPEICRSLRLEYLNETNGTNLYEFHLAKNIFFNSSLNPANKGFCKDNDCLGNGVHSVRECRENRMQFFYSLPHFLNADRKFIQDVNGLQPNENKHDFKIKIEPVIGKIIEAKHRMQVNFYFKPNKNIDQIEKVKYVLFPIFWTETAYESSAINFS